MNLDQQFDKRIAAIHGLDNPNTNDLNTQENPVDVRHEEFQAMADVFLDESFDRRKLEQVENLQSALHKQQAVLYQRYEAGELGPEGYVESFNALLDATFVNCENILGQENFLKLFGTPRSELAGFIDKEAFLQAHQTRTGQGRLAEQKPTPSNASPQGAEHGEHMGKRGIISKMDALTAYSTLALAVFTLALVILAAVNFQKFNENVSLVAQGLERQANSINLQAQSLKAQAESIDLQSKDILLNYKPVVFIKEVVPLENAQDTSDPYKYAFILTNSGKLPARNVEVSMTANMVSGTTLVLGLIHTIMDKASIYPGTNLVFHVSRAISFGGKIDKAQFRFKIRYTGDGLPQQMYENMNYIFSDQTNRRWIYTGPKVDIFFKEKFDRKKSQCTDLANVEISEGRQSVIKRIVDDIVGTDKVLQSNANELITLFTTVSKEIREMKHFRTYGLNAGALTGLRGPVRIIDENDQLTLIGVSVFKCVGEVLGSEEIESDQ